MMTLFVSVGALVAILLLFWFFYAAALWFVASPGRDSHHDKSLYTAKTGL